MYWAFGGGRRAPTEAEAPEGEARAPAEANPTPRRVPSPSSLSSSAAAERAEPASLFESDAFFRLGRVLSQQQHHSPPQAPQQQVSQCRPCLWGGWTRSKGEMLTIETPTIPAGHQRKRPGGVRLPSLSPRQAPVRVRPGLPLPKPAGAAARASGRRGRGGEPPALQHPAAGMWYFGQSGLSERLCVETDATAAAARG